MSSPKRGIYLIFILILATSVSAAHTATITTNYLQIYETTTENITLTVENGFLSTSSINNITINPSGFQILAATTPSDWTLTIGSLINYFTEKGAISNWGSQNFGLEIKAGKVDADETHDWTFITTDYNGDSATNVLHFQVINDATPPSLLNIIPLNNSFLKEGASQLFSVEATDPETGVESVSLVYGLCSNVTNIASLAKNNNVYSDQISFPYPDSTVVCYRFSAQNNGGAIATYPGQLTIDGKPPVVALVAPGENAMMNNNSMFSFIAADNLAPTLNCLLYVDGRNEANMTANNNETATIAASEAPEGTHKWSVKCQDLVGWEAESSERTFTLDKTPPNITIKSPASAIIKAGTPIVVEVNDNYGVDNVWYEFQNSTVQASESFSIDTTNGTDGVNTVIFYANDTVGNLRTLEYNFIIDKAPPEIELTFPDDSATVDIHTTYYFTATDNYDPVLDCTLHVGNDTAAVTANSSLPAQISRITDIGEYNWYVECIDDADNIGKSDERAIKVVDVSGPDIAMEDIGALPRGATVEIDANITDYSGVDSVSGMIIYPNGNNETVNFTKNGDRYSAEFLTTANSILGDYQAVIRASDTLGNSATASKTFTLVNSFVITMQVSSPVNINKNVVVNGSVRSDDGQEVQVTLTIQTPSGTNSIQTLPSGDFSYVFKAPSSAGKYNVKALLEINGLSVSETKQFEVRKPGSSSGRGHSGGSSGTVEQPRSDRSGIIVTPENKEEQITEEETDKSGITEPEENRELNHSVIILPEKPKVPVGKASGLFSLNSLKSTRLWLILLIAALLIGLLKLGSKGRRKDNIGLDSYIRRIKRNY